MRTLTAPVYPSDRVNNFSDAIYAIAITLLVLEVKIPSADEVAQRGIAGVLTVRIPNFIGFVVSFFVTALFWKAHLLLFRKVKAISSRLLWLNLWQLLFVVLMPFSTALYSYYVGSNNAFIFYCLNVAGIGFMGYVLTAHVVRTENLEQEMGRVAATWMRRRTLIAPFVFLFCIPLVWIDPWVARFGFLLIFLVQLWGDRVMKKRIQAEALPVEN
jgi:uncharacterized membrane protein